MKILFSPVGGTDPISNTNCQDGSMLHICRVYQPDKVILYMSKEILELHRKDNRFFYCLDKLCELQNRTMEYEVIERPKLNKVYEFDYFYRDFKEIMDGLIGETISAEDELLLNISSGTPAMKSGLVVLKTLSEYPCKLIQVITPDKKMNEHHHDNYDVESLWELDEDNQEGFENRCREVICPNLSELIQIENIKKHIKAYDYSAAMDVAENLSEERIRDFYDLLEMAYYRELLDILSVNKLAKKTKVSFLPITEEKKCQCFEYALNLEIKLRKQNYADFIRGITPLLVDLFELIIKKQTGIDINDYCAEKKNGSGVRRDWNMLKLQGTEVLKALEAEYFPREFTAGFVKSDNLVAILNHFCKNQKAIKVVRSLREVEEKIRNMAAHQIVSITERTIVDKTGFSGTEIMDLIRKAFTYTEIIIPEGAWDSYDTMNQMIIDQM
ncbi:MAG: CRISPR-associated protein Csm6 [Anaerobutyricum sp.]|nr:CRISPR-associated protein Csm6 [Anaerobutyricum sp.]